MSVLLTSGKPSPPDVNGFHCAVILPLSDSAALERMRKGIRPSSVH